MNSAALHQAIYTRLANFTALTSQVVGVYAKVPQPDQAEDDAAFPFVTFNVASVAPLDTKTSDGGSALINVHVYSRTKSIIARRAVEDSVYDALHKFDLPIAGANTIAAGFQTKTEFDDADGVTTHGVLTFRITYDDI